MKKLLLVLMVVALASFLFVGCVPTTVDDGDDVVDGDVVAEICPAITVTDSYTDPISGKTYVKLDEDLEDLMEVVVTYAQPTEGVGIYLVGGMVPFGLEVELAEKAGIWDLELSYTVSADGLTYTAEVPFWMSPMWGPCQPIMIKVVGCEGLCECVESFILDWDSPYVKLEATVNGGLEDCPCGGCSLTVSSVTEESVCDPDVVCCGDDCSGLASWSFLLFDDYPWNVCCDTGCEDPVFEDSGTTCPITFTTSCLEPDVYYAVLSLVDNVGNETNVAAKFEVLDTDDCVMVWDDPEVPDGCDYDDFCIEWDDEDNPTFFIDPSDTMDEDCGTCDD
jgi:predicted small secreted protein